MIIVASSTILAVLRRRQAPRTKGEGEGKRRQSKRRMGWRTREERGRCTWWRSCSGAGDDGDEVELWRFRCR